jgi:hypothetical protein
MPPAYAEQQRRSRHFSDYMPERENAEKAPLKQELGRETTAKSAGTSG